MIDLNIIVDKLLDMKPDPIPEFILLKEFRKISPDSREYQDAYDKVCSHPFVKGIESEQNERGFWDPFHGYTEEIIRRCLSLGLDRDPCFRRVAEYLVKVLSNEESWDSLKTGQRPLVARDVCPLVSAMLSLIDPDNEILSIHRRR